MTKKSVALRSSTAPPLAADTRVRRIQTYFDPRTVAAAASQFPSIDEMMSTNHGKAVSARLSGSQEAIDSFFMIAPDDRKQWLVLSACIEAEHLRRTFHLRIANAEAMNRKLDRLAGAAGELLMFLDKLGEPEDFRLSGAEQVRATANAARAEAADSKDGSLGQATRAPDFFTCRTPDRKTCVDRRNCVRHLCSSHDCADGYLPHHCFHSAP